MNFLAHAYLSFNKPEILIGNLISDFVKGKKQYDYPKEIQHGIKLHRAIDNFTDEHAITNKAKEFFRPYYRLYSGPLVDIVFDHFLANDPNYFPDKTALKNFSQKNYQIISAHINTLPENFQKIFPYMHSQDWLFNYQHKDFIKTSMNGLVKRATFISDPSMANEVFLHNYSEIEICFQHFFPELKSFASDTLTKLLNF